MILEETKLLTPDDELIKDRLSWKYRKNWSKKEKQKRLDSLKLCDHPYIRYSELESCFKCKKCNEKLIECDFQSYKMFCFYAQIPISKLIEN